MRDQTNPANRFKFNRLAFECLIKTCQKQGLTFFDYLGARLRVPDSPLIPPLPDPIRARVTL